MKTENAVKKISVYTLCLTLALGTASMTAPGASFAQDYISKSKTIDLNKPKNEPLSSAKTIELNKNRTIFTAPPKSVETQQEKTETPPTPYPAQSTNTGSNDTPTVFDLLKSKGRDKEFADAFKNTFGECTDDDREYLKLVEKTRNAIGAAFNADMEEQPETNLTRQDLENMGFDYNELKKEYDKTGEMPVALREKIEEITQNVAGEYTEEYVAQYYNENGELPDWMKKLQENGPKTMVNLTNEIIPAINSEKSLISTMRCLDTSLFFQ